MKKISCLSFTCVLQLSVGVFCTFTSTFVHALDRLSEVAFSVHNFFGWKNLKKGAMWAFLLDKE